MVEISGSRLDEDGFGLMGRRLALFDDSLKRLKTLRDSKWPGSYDPGHSTLLR